MFTDEICCGCLAKIKKGQLNSYDLQFQMNIVVLFKVEMLTFFLKQEIVTLIALQSMVYLPICDLENRTRHI